MNDIGSVLVIEDNPGDARLVAEHLLDRLGKNCDVRRESSLADGLLALSRSPADIVLLDLGLPDCAGLETLQRFAAQAPDTPVVVLTGNDDDELALAALQVGAEDYLDKARIDGAGLLRTLRLAVQRRRLSRALRESELRHRTIVETAEEGIAQVNGQGLILLCNERLATLLGVPKAALLGGLLPQWVHPRHQAQAMTLLATQPGQRNSAELQLRRPDGSLRWVVAAAGSIAEPRGDLFEVVLMLTDITARRLAENELRQLRDELEQRVLERTSQLRQLNADLEAFNASVAHDLRSPLHGILGLAELMQRDGAASLSEVQAKHLHTIRDSATQMNSLISGLLGLARIAPQALQFEALDVSTMALSVLTRLQQAEPGRRVRFVVHPGLLAVGDKGMVASVLQNLLENAWKYSQRNADAMIEIGKTRTALSDNSFFVRDNGVGFEPALTDKLFKPFSRLPSSRGFAGSGIGLATVRRIAERHGGLVWAHSEPGVSTTFFFTLSAQTPVPVAAV
jgi:PAS domain S-box-containing protein